MIASDKDHPDGGSLQEQLVAYLDGELDDGASRDIEDLLVSDAGARDELHNLERAWDLLDDLPRAQVDDDFARSTIEMVAVSAAEELAEDRRQAPKRRIMQWLVRGSGVVAAGLCGFIALRSAWPDPNQQLLDDYPVLAQFEQYVEVQEIGVLRELEKIGFSAVPTHVPPNALSGAVSTVSQRRDLIATLPQTERESLSRKVERMNQLKPVEQQRLRELHSQIQQDPSSKELQSALAGYHDWLQNLPLKERAELQALGAPERLERIKAIWQHPADREAIAVQIEELMVTRLNRSSDPNRASDPNRTKELAAMPAVKRRGALLLMASNVLRSRFDRLEITPQVIDSLKTKLTPSGQEKIERLPTFDKQRTLVVGWFRDVVGESNKEFYRNLREEITDEELGQYYASLSDERKADLVSISDEQRQDRLRWMYVWAKKIQELPKFVHPYSPEGTFGPGSGMLPRPGGSLPRPGGQGTREPGSANGSDGGRNSGPRGRNDGTPRAGQPEPTQPNVTPEKPDKPAP